MAFFFDFDIDDLDFWLTLDNEAFWRVCRGSSALLMPESRACSVAVFGVLFFDVFDRVFFCGCVLVVVLTPDVDGSSSTFFCEPISRNKFVFKLKFNIHLT